MNLVKHTSLHVALLFLSCLVVITPAAAAALDAHLPVETLVYLQWSGRSLTFDGSKFGQMILDPQVKELVGFFQGLIEENAHDERDAAMLFRIWSCAAIAWEHPVVAGLYDINENGLSAVLLVDLGEDKDAFAAEFQKLLTMMTSRPDAPEGQELSTTTVGDGSYTLLPSKKKYELAYGYIGNVFFFTFGKDQARALLERKPDASLQTNKKYQDCLAAVGGENVQFAVYADIEAMTTPIKALLSHPASERAEATTQPAENPADRITKALGVDKAHAVAGTVRVVDKGMYTKIRLFTTAPHKGLLFPLAGATLSDADLAGIPGDVDLAVAANISLQAVYGELRRVLKEIEPNADRMAEGGIQAFERPLEISLEKDLLGSLGDTWVYSVSPSQGGPIVGSMISVDVADPEKLWACIDKLENAFLPSAPTAPSTAPHRRRAARLRPRIGAMKVGDSEIHYLRTPRKGLGMAFLPAWAVHKNRLYLAMWPQVIASALENTTPPLTKSPEYQALRKRFSPNASAMVYVNTPEIMKKLYPLQLVGGTLLMNAIAGETHTSQPIPLWPGSLQSVLKYLIPQMNVISHDAEGITFEGYGTCPSILPAVPLMTSVALPTATRARSKARKAVSLSNLRAVCLACHMYANDHDGRLPDRLDELNEYLGLSRGKTKLLVNPVSGKQPPTWDAQEKKITGPVDYVLLDYSDKSISQLSSAETMLVYEDPANYQNRGTVVGFVDRHTEWVDMPRFQKLLKKARAKRDDEK